MTARTIHAADLFCGAGGTSTGLARAADGAGRKLQLVAVNHWDTAVETHAKNHPDADHRCASLDSLDPRQVVGRRRLDLLIASPECTHHSIARGGRPVNDQSRASGWHVVHWAEQLRPRAILVENVKEFRSWGPIGSNGRPLKSRRGETYRAWVAALKSLGYRVEERLLRAADYGDPTTRERLFVVAVRGRIPFSWPAPTHARDGEADLFGSRLPWRAAREIIDWDDRGRSIFGRTRPLADATLRRIAEGLRRFGGGAAEPFLMMLTHGGRLRSIDEPVPTVTAANRGELAVVQPFIVPRYGERPGQRPRTRAIDAPAPTIPATNQHALVEPLLVRYQGNRPCDMRRGQRVDWPLGTLDTSNRYGIVRPFLVRYQGTGGAESVADPVSTVTTRDRHGLVEPTEKLDILFRMLQPRELARAQGFPDTYEFAGNRGDVVRQIGNAVPVNLATALCGSLLARAS